MIETDRLILRPHRLEDLDASYALFSDPQVVVFIGGQPMRREDVWNRLLRYHGHWRLLGYGIFAIFDRVSGACLGETGLADFHRDLGSDFDPFPEAAWAVSTAAQGRGYAYEAAAAAHRWLDAHHPARRTVCIINPANTRSVRLAEALGYRSFREADYKDARITLFERSA